MVELITNETDEKHLGVLKSLINRSNEILMAVAFLRESGLELLKNDIENALKRGAKIKIFCGLDFRLTQPKALRELYLLFKDQNGQLYLYSSDSKEYTFHPKIYYFVGSDKAYVLIGSANFTGGGFKDNKEVSVLEEVAFGSSLHKKINKFFENLKKSPNVIEATEWRISFYEKEYDAIKPSIDKANREIAKKMESIKGFRKVSKIEERIKKYLNKYLKDTKEEQDYKNRVAKYKEAKKVLETMYTKPINSREEFMRYYEKLVGKEGQPGLWHSGILFRQKNRVAASYEIFIRMLREIKDNIEKSPREVFEIGLNYIKKIDGLGVNVVTEIMNTYNSKKFAVLNNLSIESLRFLWKDQIKGDLIKFPSPYYFKPETYERYTLLLEDLMKKYGLKSLGQVDHFLNYVYQHYIKGKKKTIR